MILSIDELKDKFAKYLSILLHNLILQLIVSIVLGASYLYYVGILFDVLVYEIKVWQIILVLFIFSLVYWIYFKIINNENIYFKKFGLMWEAKIQNNKFKSILGPLCPNCDCDISHTLIISPPEQTLSCSKCQQTFKVNAYSIENLRKDIEEIVKTDLVGNKILEFNIIFHSIDNFILWVKNKGVFTVKELNISISLNIKGEKTEVWDCFFKKLDPGLKQKIDEQDLDTNLEKAFGNSGLIDIHSYEHPEIIGDEWDAKEIFVVEKYLRLKKEFSATLIITSKYFLKNKSISKDTKYSIDFKYHDIDDLEYFYPIDDCHINVYEMD